MQAELASLRSLRATTNFSQREIAARMGVDEWVVSRVLRGKQGLTPDFETGFRAAVAELAAEKAQADLAAAEASAQALRQAAGVVEKDAVAA